MAPYLPRVSMERVARMNPAFCSTGITARSPNAATRSVPRVVELDIFAPRSHRWS